MSTIRKLSVALTPEMVVMVRDAVASGDYASTSEVVREALRDWKAKRLIGRLWDEGVASGSAEDGETIDEIAADAMRTSIAV